ncbi:ATP-binding protein [Roseibium alexandrii]|uniref:ATP-binding protein n=1 Tax=Roseibium alexandrii TaxID=388408 RepID=UPI0037535089
MFRQSVQLRLSTAIAVLFLVILLISSIALTTLRDAEGWLDIVHRDTLAEVSRALELSSGAADLATSAPFLITVQIPALMDAEVTSVLETIAEIEKLAGDDPALSIPLSRMRVAILDMNRAASPKSGLDAEISRIERDLVRLQNRFKRRASMIQTTLNERLYWAELQQLTAEAIGAARARELISVGEYSYRYQEILIGLPRSLNTAMENSLRELKSVLEYGPDHLFVVKHRALTSALDAENALFRIRRASNQLTSYADKKVEEAEGRLTLAQAQTTRNLVIAQRVVLGLALLSSLIAIGSALFVSRYVAANLRRIAEAMRRLAAGDLHTDLQHNTKQDDEIGQLFEAFNVFRANARKLERHTTLIHRQNALFARVFRNIHDGVAILSVDGTIEAENDKVRQLLRLPAAGEGEKGTLSELIHKSAFERQDDDLDRGGFEEFVDPNGHVVEIRQSQLPDGGSVWLFSETTERKRINERLEEIRRVESLGKLTGEVAHDFGNILSTISGNVHLLESADAERMPVHLARISAAVDLGVTLTERLLAFARKQHLEPEVVEIGALVDGMTDLLCVVLSDDIDLVVDICDHNLYARVDPGQLESAILNLCINSGQAISGKGSVNISVAAEDADTIVLVISDTGSGMSPEIMHRASEPFFSNRSDGAGTGLGLSMVHGFVHQSGGTMEIESSLGEGTRIRLRFPVFNELREEESRYQADGLALIVDDNPASADAVQKVLRGFGFTTEIALNFSDGMKALTRSSPIRLIVTDLQLDHDKSGWELVRFALQTYEERHAILMSSKLPDAVDLDQALLPQFDMVAKPINRDALKEVLIRWGLLSA